jgi:hypothetical protein
MKSTSASVSRLAVMLVILAMSLTSTVLMNGQEAQAKQAKGVPVDWTHQHVVFSNPGTADEAIRNGSYERWLKISTDPRYIMQQQKRSANASGAALQHGSSQDALNDATQDVPQDALAAKPVALEPRAEQADARVQAYEEGAGTIEMSLEEREAARGGNRRLPSGLVRAIIPPPIKPADSPQAKKKKRNRIKKDWSEDLGNNGTTGLGQFPAIFTTGGTSCNDFAVFNTGLPGASGQANIIAYNNLYASCNGGVPTVYWAYNTSGGTVFNSVVLSEDGSQVAFVQSSSGGVASLVLLKWKAASVTLTTPVSLTSTSYSGCTAPCMTTLTFNGSPNDSYSAPFVDFATSTAFVGDDGGKLHKFTNIFTTGTPAEATTSGWPVTVNSNASLGSPVYDTVSANVYVGDYLLSSSSGCEPSATNTISPCGFLYSVNATSAAVTKSAQLDFNFGIMDGPVIDSSTNAREVYVFAGDDGSTSCTSSTPCAAVYQIPMGFSAGAKGTEATVGAGYEFIMSGTFDNAYYSSSAPTGHLYVVGNTGPANNTLYQVTITNDVMSTSTTAGPVVSNSYTNGHYSAGLQVAEFYTGTIDYIFLSVLSFGVPAGAGECGTSSLGNGCVMGFNVNSGTISGSTTPTGATAEPGGTSGIVVDSGATGAQNIYFSTLLNGTCTGGTGGCAIQTSQSAP